MVGSCVGRLAVAKKSLVHSPRRKDDRLAPAARRHPARRGFVAADRGSGQSLPVSSADSASCDRLVRNGNDGVPRLAATQRRSVSPGLEPRHGWPNQWPVPNPTIALGEQCHARWRPLFVRETGALHGNRQAVLLLRLAFLHYDQIRDSRTPSRLP